MNKRIIICGPVAAGKDHLKKKFGKRGFKLDVSYTTRSPREGEVNGIDYHFISEEEFMDESTQFYEYAKHGNYYYGTGMTEWNECDVFIMETEGIAGISEKDKKKCFIIYLNPPEGIRLNRLQIERKWDYPKIMERFKIDNEKFKNFKDYDIEITNPNF